RTSARRRLLQNRNDLLFAEPGLLHQSSPVGKLYSQVVLKIRGLHAVLLTQLPQLAQLCQAQAAVLLLPDVERRLADPHLPGNIPDRRAALRLFQGVQDLLFRIPRSLHWPSSLLRCQGPTPAIYSSPKPL